MGYWSDLLRLRLGTGALFCSLFLSFSLHFPIPLFRLCSSFRACLFFLSRALFLSLFLFVLLVSSSCFFGCIHLCLDVYGCTEASGFLCLSRLTRPCCVFVLHFSSLRHSSFSLNAWMYQYSCQEESLFSNFTFIYCHYRCFYPKRLHHKLLKNSNLSILFFYLNIYLNR